MSLRFGINKAESWLYIVDCGSDSWLIGSVARSQDSLHLSLGSLDSRLGLLDFGSARWILGSACWIHGLACWIIDSAHRITGLAQWIVSLTSLSRGWPYPDLIIAHSPCYLNYFVLVELALRTIRWLFCHLWELVRQCF